MEMGGILYLLLLFFQFHSIPKVVGLDAITDKESLLLFKLKVSDPLNALSSWTQNSSHCSWFAISCSTTETNRVQSIQLPGLELSGNLPAEISNLTSLQLLDLSNNSFHGQIPSQLGFLQKLERLDLSVNNLTGVVPSSYGNLSSLTHLYLSRNQLHGEIPSEIGSLVNLIHLQLSQNDFVGEIPVPVYNLSSLELFSVTANNLSGKLPEDLGIKLPNLKQLLMANNGFDGKIPNSISNASKLQVIDLSGNQFDGSIPVFGNLKNLTRLVLGKNLLTSDTSLNFQFFESLKNSTKLELLMIFTNRLSGELPNSIANLSTNLQQFCIAENNFNGSFPRYIGNYPNLISFSIEMNSFTGDMPAIGNQKNLEQILMYQNSFSGEIPDFFGNFTSLFLLFMGYNQFSGSIPKSIGQCQQLSMLDLQATKLEGNVPREIFGISSLRNIYMGYNSFTGQIPQEIGSLKHLQLINLSNNKLSGNLTTAIGSCSSLEGLYLQKNNFSGSIPSSLANLESVEKIDLSSNNFSGQIPQELEELPNLMTLNLSFNHLEGEVPTKGVFMNATALSLQGNYELCSTTNEIEITGISQCDRKKRKTNILLKIIAPVAAFILLINIIIFVLMFRKKNKNRNRSSSISTSLKGLLNPKVSYSDIQIATNNFAAENLIGKGGFGSVYKGLFNFSSHGNVKTILAVKVLDLQQGKAAKSFNTECEALRNIRHRNLVKVITSCSSIDHNGNEFKALIMEFMSSGNLDTWLYPIDESGVYLNLLQRLNIAIDVASAMDYLHHGSDPPLIHCDLKPGNILLDQNMTAHVADFGLSRFLSQSPSENESSTLALKGSIGYIAPEYGMGEKASRSGDVYSFGVLLLEMFIGRKPTDPAFQEGLRLNKFELAVKKNQVREIVDQRLMIMDYNETSTAQSTSNDSSSISISCSNDWLNKSEECVASVLKACLSCISHSPKARLSMTEMLNKLKEIKKLMLEI